VVQVQLALPSIHIFYSFARTVSMFSTCSTPDIEKGDGTRQKGDGRGDLKLIGTFYVSICATKLMKSCLFLAMLVWWGLVEGTTCVVPGTTGCTQIGLGRGRQLRVRGDGRGGWRGSWGQGKG
jgi:hypothetical protein